MSIQVAILASIMVAILIIGRLFAGRFALFIVRVMLASWLTSIAYAFIKYSSTLGFNWRNIEPTEVFLILFMINTVAYVIASALVKERTPPIPQ